MQTNNFRIVIVIFIPFPLRHIQQLAIQFIIVVDRTVGTTSCRLQIISFVFTVFRAAAMVAACSLQNAVQCSGVVIASITVFPELEALQRDTPGVLTVCPVLSKDAESLTSHEDEIKEPGISRESISLQWILLYCACKDINAIGPIRIHPPPPPPFCFLGSHTMLTHVDPGPLSKKLRIWINSSSFHNSLNYLVE